MAQFRHRPAAERGHTQLDWLESAHGFSFGHYVDPAWMGFAHLRVFNDDHIAPGAGFGTHPHRDMEIISYAIEGSLQHRDSMGNGSIIRPGDVQLMRAGTGITHSEFNASDEQPCHFLQIWLLPRETGLDPAYAQAHFPAEERQGRLRLVVAHDGRDGALQIAQDADIYAASLDSETTIEYVCDLHHAYWVHVVRGECRINDIDCHGGDAVGIDACELLTMSGSGEVLLFDMWNHQSKP